jgi:hypothetical protein
LPNALASSSRLPRIDQHVEEQREERREPDAESDDAERHEHDVPALRPLDQRAKLLRRLRECGHQWTPTRAAFAAALPPEGEQ